jgi:drug/metabolite transporter (DMT)-like permease
MVFAIPIGAFIFGEPVDRWVILGMAITVGAGLYAIRREYRLMRLAREPAMSAPPPP